jgi:hypothetical protein
MASMTERKSPIEQALDLFFYAPLGFLMNAQEIVPQLVEKGHQQVVTARMFGKFAVDQAPGQLANLQKQVEKVAEELVGRAGARRPAPSGAKATKRASSSPATRNGQASEATQTSAPVSEAPVSEAPASTAAPAHGPGAAQLAIPDYDSLSASQVVPRLEGLSDSERAAVRDYESTHRGRKTILNKIDQLQA